jgi:hypothetical protein
MEISEKMMKKLTNVMKCTGEHTKTIKNPCTLLSK